MIPPKDDLPLIICIPVVARPDFKSNYSHYESVPCPDCGGQMWLGVRSKIMADAGKGHPTCGYCAHEKYQITFEDMGRMQKLTDFDV